LWFLIIYFDKLIVVVNRLAVTNEENSKMCKIWFYGENQYVRNKTNLLTLNETASKNFWKNKNKKIVFD